MDLSKYDWQELTTLDMAFSTLNTPRDLLEEAESRDLEKGREKFNELFFSGGEIKLKSDVKDTWKEKAIKFALALMRSFAPKHEDKEAVCALIFEECLKL